MLHIQYFCFSTYLSILWSLCSHCSVDTLHLPCSAHGFDKVNWSTLPKKEIWVIQAAVNYKVSGQEPLRMLSVGCTVKDKTTELYSIGQEITQAQRALPLSISITYKNLIDKNLLSHIIRTLKVDFILLNTRVLRCHQSPWFLPSFWETTLSTSALSFVLGPWVTSPIATK